MTIQLRSYRVFSPFLIVSGSQVIKPVHKKRASPILGGIMLLYELAAVVQTPLGIGVTIAAVLMLSGIMTFLGGRNER